MFPEEKGLKAWVAANGLRARGIKGLRLLAFAKRTRWFGGREGFLMMEALEDGQEMDRYLVKGFDGFSSRGVSSVPLPTGSRSSITRVFIIRI